MSLIGSGLDERNMGQTVTTGAHRGKAVLRREQDPDPTYFERRPRARPLSKPQKPMLLAALSPGDTFTLPDRPLGTVLAKGWNKDKGIERFMVLVTFEGGKKTWTWLAGDLKVVPS